MMQVMKRITVGVCALATLAGCANVQSAGPGNEEQVVVEADSKSRTNKTLLTIGGILLLGAIIANEAGDNVEDAVRDAVRP